MQRSPTCHGGVKGRGGFKLSAGALYPKDDYEWIVKGGAYQVLTAAGGRYAHSAHRSQGPREEPAAAEADWLRPARRRPAIRDGFPGIPHDRCKWIQNGAPFGPERRSTTKCTSLEVFPKIVTLERGGTHRLLVTAHFTEAARKTSPIRLSTNRTTATSPRSDENGIVKAATHGETAILVRAAGQAASATVGVIGAPVAALSQP